MVSQYGSWPDRPENRLHEPFRRLPWIVRDLQRLPCNPDGPVVGRQELPAAPASAHMRLQLSALGPGQRLPEVVGCQVFQLRARDHLGPWAARSDEGLDCAVLAAKVAVFTHTASGRAQPAS